MNELSNLTFGHRTILSSLLERTKIIFPKPIKKFFGDRDVELELWVNNSYYFLDLNLLLSHKIPYALSRFKEENSGKEAYEKIVNILNDGGRIYLDFIPYPEIVDNQGRTIRLIEEKYPLRQDYLGGFGE